MECCRRTGSEKYVKRQRERFTRKVFSLGLTITALCGDIGGFTEESNVKERIKRTKEFLDLSIDLRTPIVTTHIGIIPKNKNTKERKIMQEALKELGKYGERIGAYLAVETGPESPELMQEFLEKINSSSLKINYDPANLIMRGYDPVKGSIFRKIIAFTLMLKMEKKVMEKHF